MNILPELNDKKLGECGDIVRDRNSVKYEQDDIPIAVSSSEESMQDGGEHRVEFVRGQSVTPDVIRDDSRISSSLRLFTDDYLCTVSTNKLNHSIRNFAVSLDDVRILKKRRRTLKNRFYARSSRCKSGQRNYKILADMQSQTDEINIDRDASRFKLVSRPKQIEIVHDVEISVMYCQMNDIARERDDMLRERDEMKYERDVLKCERDALIVDNERLKSELIQLSFQEK